ncbi:MAG: hypothetical protein J6D47_08820 [Peptostreptococcaceae bacterium]|jgi:hypothetical protein|nr:hypothetical protein [Peptostreptococcaceae bacterium]
MKKIFLSFIYIVIIMLSIVGCSNKIVENSIEVENFVPSDMKEEIGSGQFIISTYSEIGENNIPVFFSNEFNGLSQIKIQSNEFDGSKSSYIYIDSKLNTIENLGEMNVFTLTVDKENMSKGIHKVEVIQFDNNKISGNPVTYKVCTYEVK